MADVGYSYDSLVASLSALGTSSGELISLSITGSKNRVLPLVDYGDFSQHVFFSDAIRKFNTSLDRIINDYPIGASGTDTSSLCAENIYKVDEEVPIKKFNSIIKNEKLTIVVVDKTGHTKGYIDEECLNNFYKNPEQYGKT